MTSFRSRLLAAAATAMALGTPVQAAEPVRTAPVATPTASTQEFIALGVARLRQGRPAEARDLLRDCGGFGGLEAWVAGRRWKPAPGGWIVSGELQGWSFQLEVVPRGLRVSARAPDGGSPAVWTVTR